MTDLRRLQNGLNRLDMDEIRKALDLYGECACEAFTSNRCRHCGQWICAECLSDHMKWESEEDPKTQRGNQ